MIEQDTLSTVLQDKATAVTKEYDLLKKDVSSACERAVRIGKLCTELKTEVGHGNWEQFCNDHLPFGPRKARQYMRAANRKLTSDLSSGEILAIAHGNKKPERNKIDPRQAYWTDEEAAKFLQEYGYEVCTPQFHLMRDIDELFGNVRVRRMLNPEKYQSWQPVRLIEADQRKLVEQLRDACTLLLDGPAKEAA